MRPGGQIPTPLLRDPGVPQTQPLSGSELISQAMKGFPMEQFSPTPFFSRQTLTDGSPLCLGMPLEEVQAQMIPLKETCPQPRDPQHGLPQPLRASPLVTAAPCLAPARPHRGHPRLLPDMELSQRWCRVGFAGGTTWTLLCQLHLFIGTQNMGQTLPWRTGGAHLQSCLGSRTRGLWGRGSRFGGICMGMMPKWRRSSGRGDGTTREDLG